MSEAEQMITRSEYLSFEREGQVRHEWVGGQMWMMTGGSGRHNLPRTRIALVGRRHVEQRLPGVHG
jgi:hypothetical protein